MFGGYDGSNLNSVERFDHREGNSSVLVKSMKERRGRASAAAHNEQIYVTGGYALGRGLDSVEMLVVCFLLILPINFALFCVVLPCHLLFVHTLLF